MSGIRPIWLLVLIAHGTGSYQIAYGTGRYQNKQDLILGKFGIDISELDFGFELPMGP